MARWDRDAESLYNLSPVTSGNRSRGARPLKANLYLVRLNNKCLILNRSKYLILIVTDPGQEKVSSPEQSNSDDVEDSSIREFN